MHHYLTAAAFLILLLSLSLIACDALLGGKPNINAPKGASDDDLTTVCAEAQQEIRDWERDEVRKIEDDFVEGKVTTLGAGIKALRIEEEADKLRDELGRVCAEEYHQRFGPQTLPTSKPPGQPFPTSTRPASRRR